MNHTENEAALLRVLLDYAPDAKAQEAMVKWFNDGQVFCADQAMPDALVRALAYALTDGLTHGTWPWMPSRV